MGVIDLCLRNECRLGEGHTGRCRPFTKKGLKNLPDAMVKKLNKTLYTRGAQPYDRVPYQNRVSRWNRAVIPFRFRGVKPEDGYENGSTIMVRPDEYFSLETRMKREDFPQEVQIGTNAFVYYDNRRDWENYNPAAQGWELCKYIGADGKELGQRRSQGTDIGHYLARVPAVTTEGPKGDSVVGGIPQGIRFFEYASQRAAWKVEMQLAYLAWKTEGIEEYSQGPMSGHLRAILEHDELADISRLEESRAMRDGNTSCPLCGEIINARELLTLIVQQKGREVFDLTVTEATLFHLLDLRPGEFNHDVYKVGWGHYHCNVVARDMGIIKTLDWMEEVLRRNNRI